MQRPAWLLPLCIASLGLAGCADLTEPNAITIQKERPPAPKPAVTAEAAAAGPPGAAQPPGGARPPMPMPPAAGGTE